VNGTLKNPIDKRRLSVKSYPRIVSLSLRLSNKFLLLFFHRSSDSLYASPFFLREPSLSVSRVTSNIFLAVNIYFIYALQLYLAMFIFYNAYFKTQSGINHV